MSAALEQLRESYDNRHQLARQWQGEGRQLCGYLYSYVPEELIHAAGMLPIQLTDCDDRETYLQGKEYLEDFYCDFACSCLGQGIRGNYSYLAGMIFPDACETVRTTAAVWKLHAGTPFFHWFATCYEDTPGSRTFFHGEMLELKGALEGFTGRAITDAALHQSIRVYDENRALVQQLYALRQLPAPPLTGRELFDAVKAGLVMPKEEHNRLLRQWLDDLAGKAGRPRQGPRLFLSCLIFEETISQRADIVKMIEELGGDIVVDDLGDGVRYLSRPVGDGADPIAALTERYLAAVPGAFRYPCERRARDLVNLAEQHQIQGAIAVIPRYCTPYLWEYPYVRQRLEEHGVATLMLESVESMTYAPVRTRVEAFIEMLSA